MSGFPSRLRSAKRREGLYHADVFSVAVFTCHAKVEDSVVVHVAEGDGSRLVIKTQRTFQCRHKVTFAVAGPHGQGLLQQVLREQIEMPSWLMSARKTSPDPGPTTTGEAGANNGAWA